MSTVELKEKLIAEILKTENSGVLGEVLRLLELESDDLEVARLSDEQKEAILRGQEDIRKGNALTNEQADKDIAAWLNE